MLRGAQPRQPWVSHRLRFAYRAVSVSPAKYIGPPERQLDEGTRPRPSVRKLR